MYCIAILLEITFFTIRYSKMNTIQYLVFIKSLVFRNFLRANSKYHLVFGIWKFFMNEDIRSLVFGNLSNSVNFTIRCNSGIDLLKIITELLAAKQAVPLWSRNTCLFHNRSFWLKIRKDIRVGIKKVWKFPQSGGGPNPFHTFFSFKRGV